MQPLAHSHISPALKWPTVLPQARPWRVVCTKAKGGRDLGNFRFYHVVKKRWLPALSQTEDVLGYVNMTTVEAVISTVDF